MRWDNLLATGRPGTGETGSARATLPLALPGAVVRTFDTPEFRGMTFHEVRAKSIINRVPGASRVPFQWTLNPYRGCSHSCVYCLAGDTPVLMASGDTRALADLRVGDRVIGTRRVGRQRRYVVTEVLAHWSTVKPAYRVRLGDGTALVASAEHRFLSERGWKHVTGAVKRPHLTTANRLRGVGAFASAPAESPAYLSGYLCGFVHGDGHVGPVAPAALTRARVYAARCGGLHPLADDRREFSGASVRDASSVLDWPLSPTRDWRRGLLAGLFDATAPLPSADPGAAGRPSSGALAAGPLPSPGPSAAGSPASSNGPSSGALAAGPASASFAADVYRAAGGATSGEFGAGDPRLGGAAGVDLVFGEVDKVVVDWIVESLEVLGFASVVESGRVRVLGGLRERLRFRHVVGPVVSTGPIAGEPVRGDDALRVHSVEALDVELPMFDITTGTGDFVANGVISHNCFARNTHTYLDLDAGHDFDTQVVVKVNAGELLRRELASPRWSGDHIAMGTNVDVYQRAEGRYRLMRQILTALRDFANPFSILTKGTLIARDLDLLQQAAEVTTVGVSFSVGFVDETVWRQVEPGTPSPRHRLGVVRRFTDAGFRVGVLMAPILPGLTDSPESIERTVTAIADAGAASITPLALHLRPGAKEWYATWLRREHPELLPRYRELYGKGAYLGQAYQRELTARVRLAARRAGLPAAAMSNDPQPTDPPPARRMPVNDRPPPDSTPDDTEQLTLL